MQSLKALQQDFQGYVLRQQTGIQAAITGTAAVSVETRLDIYRDGYFLRLLDVLEQDFPGVQALLGEEPFHQLMRRYITAYPSTYQSVRWYGDHVVLFLQTTAPYAEKPVLAEMAAFERVLVSAFDAEDAAVATLETMAAVPADCWPEMRFTLHPAVHQLRLYWNIIPLWNAIETTDAVLPVRADDAMDYLVWRREREVQFCSVSTEVAFMLEAMRTGQTFGDICEGLCAWFAVDEVALQAATLLKRFIVDGVVQEVRY